LPLGLPLIHGQLSFKFDQLPIGDFINLASLKTPNFRSANPHIFDNLDESNAREAKFDQRRGPEVKRRTIKAKESAGI